MTLSKVINKKIIQLFILGVFFLSCKQINTKQIYYPKDTTLIRNGLILHYDTTGKLVSQKLVDKDTKIVIHEILYDNKGIKKNKGEYMYFAIDTANTNPNKNKLTIKMMVYFVIPSINEIININFLILNKHQNEFIVTDRYFVDFLKTKKNVFIFKKEIELKETVFYVSILYGNKDGALIIKKNTPVIKFIPALSK